MALSRRKMSNPLPMMSATPFDLQLRSRRTRFGQRLSDRTIVAAGASTVVSGRRSNVLPRAYVSTDQLRLRFRPAPKDPLRTKAGTGTQAGLRLSKRRAAGSISQRCGNTSPAMIFAASTGESQRERIHRIPRYFVKSGNSLLCCSWIKASICSLAHSSALSPAAAELAARIAWQITASGDRVGGMVLDNLGHHIFRPFRTVRAMAACCSRWPSAIVLARPTLLRLMLWRPTADWGMRWARSIGAGGVIGCS